MSKGKFLKNDSGVYTTLEVPDLYKEPTGEAYFKNTGRLNSLRNLADRGNSNSSKVRKTFRVGKIKDAVHVIKDIVIRTNKGHFVRIGRGSSLQLDRSGILRVEEDGNIRDKKNRYRGYLNTRTDKSRTVPPSSGTARVLRDSTSNLRKVAGKRIAKVGHKKSLES